jgi:hemoglobin
MQYVLKMFKVPARLTIGRFLALVFASLSLNAFANDSLYKELGGKEGIATFTRDFVQLIMKDERIKAFFVETDADRLEGLLGEQFCELAGGPCKYSGRSMKQVHAGMGVKPSHFNALAENLQWAMEKHKVPFSAQNGLIAKLAPMHRDINNQPKSEAK